MKYRQGLFYLIIGFFIILGLISFTRKKAVDAPLNIHRTETKTEPAKSQDLDSAAVDAENKKMFAPDIKTNGEASDLNELKKPSVNLKLKPMPMPSAAGLEIPMPMPEAVAKTTQPMPMPLPLAKGQLPEVMPMPLPLAKGQLPEVMPMPAPLAKGQAPVPMPMELSDNPIIAPKKRVKDPSQSKGP